MSAQNSRKTKPKRNILNWISGRFIGNLTRFVVLMSNGLLYYGRFDVFPLFMLLELTVAKEFACFPCIECRHGETRALSPMHWQILQARYRQSSPCTTKHMGEKSGATQKICQDSCFALVIWVSICVTLVRTIHTTWCVCVWVGECARARETALVFIHTMNAFHLRHKLIVDELFEHGCWPRGSWITCTEFCLLCPLCFWWHCWLWVAIIIPSEGNFVESVWIVHDSRQRTWHSINFDKKQRDLRSHFFNGRVLCKWIPVRTQRQSFRFLILLAFPHYQ